VVSAWGIAALTVAGLALAGCGSSSTSSDSGAASSGSGSSTPAPKSGTPIKIGFVYSGVITDGGHAQAHHEAIQKAVSELGEDNFKVTEVQSTPHTDQMTQTIQRLFQQGNDVVWEFMSGGPLTYTACEQAPSKKCLGLYPVGKMPANMTGYFYDQTPQFYVEGVAAGLLTKTGTIGFVSAFKAGFNMALLNAYALGCRSVRPNCVVRNVYVNSFFDPPKAIEATNSLIDSGADVLNGYMSDPSVLVQAQKRGKLGFGLYANWDKFAPKAFVTGAQIAPGINDILREELKSLLDGTWTPGRTHLVTMKDGRLEMSPWGASVPAKVRTEVDAVVAKLNEGTFNPFKGPISDTKGKVRVAAGQTMPYPTIYAEWTWPVQGIVGA
jgi:basic membrane lipoprotein Med (substrate-binding protein (PBP1-ABC) superfamily)